MINRLAWHQLTRERLRLAAAVAGITFIVLLQLMQLGFRSALFASATRAFVPLRTDIVLTSPKYEFVVAASGFARQRLYQALMHADVTSVAAVNSGVTAIMDEETRHVRQITVLGISPDEGAFDPASLNGDFSSLRLADTVLLDAKTRPEYRPILAAFRRNHSLVADVGGRRLEVTGLFELGVDFTGNPHLITSHTTFRRIFHAPEGTIQIGLVRVRPGASVEAVRADLAATLPSDVEVLTKQQFLDQEVAYWAERQPVGFIFDSGLLVALIVGAVIVYQILYTDVTNHLPEYATLKAMGYRDSALFLVVVQESLILSILGLPVGVLLALGIYAIAREATGLPIVMTVARVALVFSLTVVMCTLSGLMAMRKLRSADPADAF